MKRLTKGGPLNCLFVNPRSVKNVGKRLPSRVGGRFLAGIFVILIHIRNPTFHGNQEPVECHVLPIRGVVFEITSKCCNKFNQRFLCANRCCLLVKFHRILRLLNCSPFEANDTACVRSRKFPSLSANFLNRCRANLSETSMPTGNSCFWVKWRRHRVSGPFALLHGGRSQSRSRIANCSRPAVRRGAA